MLGGAFLCFEGVEKVLHTFEARKHKEDLAERQKRLEALATQDPLAFEKDKVKGAVRTDFILSAEIVAITLGLSRRHRCLIRCWCWRGLRWL